jgi:hypothetical protein
MMSSGFSLRFVSFPRLPSEALACFDDAGHLIGPLFCHCDSPFEESLRDELRGSSLNPCPIRSSRSLRPWVLAGKKRVGVHQSPR